jgi:hypothetical protein
MPWKISQFPELDHLDPHQRATLLAQLPWWTYPVLLLRAGMAAGFAGIAVGGIVAQSVFQLFSGLTLALTALLSTAAAAGAGIVVYLGELNRLRTTMRAEIAKGFAGCRPPFCFACGYDLRTCGAPRCPECGKSTGEIATPSSPHPPE